MTAATIATADRAPGTGAPATTAHRVSVPRVIASEWIKLRSLRSTWWTLALTVVVMAGISTLVAWGLSQGVDGEAPTALSAATLLTAGRGMAELTIAVLGVLVITGEYTTGQIRSSFAAVPTRLSVLAAKALVLGSVVAVTSVLGMAVAYPATLPWHDALGATLDLGDGETVRILLGLPLYLVGVALLALAIGALVRRTAGAMAAVLGLLLVVETVFALVPVRFFEVVSPFLPATAGQRLLLDAESMALTDAMRDAAHLTPWQGYGVMLAWVVVLGAAATVLLRRRDA